MADNIPTRLRVLAIWHDLKDDQNGYTGPREVQDDLRKAAELMEKYVPEQEMVGVEMTDNPPEIRRVST
jgi:hypothetical protein